MICHKNHTIYADQYGQINYAISKDNTKLAYTIGTSNGPQYLVIKDLLDNSMTKLYSVCGIAIDSCIKLSNVEESM